MDMFENKENIKLGVTFADFPFICRICLQQGELRLFEEERYLLDLFLTITKINVRAGVDFPRHICNGCINELGDMSLFIDISKYNHVGFGKNIQPKKEIIECADGIENEMSQKLTGTVEGNEQDMFHLRCQICLSSASGQTAFEGNTHLIQLFQNITNIGDEVEFNSSKMNICNRCSNEMEKISSFISLSRCNDQKLENALGIENSVKTENYSNPTDTEPLTCQELQLGSVVKNEPSTGENSFFDESRVKQDIIDIKEEIIDGELATLKGESQSHLHLPYHDSKVHVITKSVGKSFKCDSCGKNFTGKANFKRHMVSHTGEKPFKCDVCEKSFGLKGNLKKHVLIHTSQNPFECANCRESFSQKLTLRFRSLIHTGDRPFKCECCEKTFISDHDLKRHMVTHTVTEPFKCHTCEKSHEQLKCGSCKKRFIQAESLKRHMLVHTVEKPVECDSCEASFTQTCSLKRHMLTHTRGKSFKCDICEKSFGQKAHLNQHRLTHTEEKSFKCDICTKSFNRKGGLKQHLLTHVGGKAKQKMFIK